MYQELEVWYPIYRLREAGCKVTVVGPEAGKEYPSKLGYPAKSDKAARDVSADDFDLLVIPGGYAPYHMRRCEPMIKLTSQMAEQGKVVAAICHGPWLLCSTQALKGKKVSGSGVVVVLSPSGAPPPPAKPVNVQPVTIKGGS